MCFTLNKICTYIIAVIKGDPVIHYERAPFNIDEHIEEEFHSSSINNNHPESDSYDEEKVLLFDETKYDNNNNFVDDENELFTNEHESEEIINDVVSLLVHDVLKEVSNFKKCELNESMNINSIYCYQSAESE